MSTRPPQPWPGRKGATRPWRPYLLSPSPPPQRTLSAPPPAPSGAPTSTTGPPPSATTFPAPANGFPRQPAAVPPLPLLPPHVALTFVGPDRQLGRAREITNSTHFEPSRNPNRSCLMLAGASGFPIGSLVLRAGARTGSARSCAAAFAWSGSRPTRGCVRGTVSRTRLRRRTSGLTAVWRGWWRRMRIDG